MRERLQGESTRCRQSASVRSVRCTLCLLKVWRRVCLVRSSAPSYGDRSLWRGGVVFASVASPPSKVVLLSEQKIQASRKTETQFMSDTHFLYVFCRRGFSPCGWTRFPYFRRSPPLLEFFMFRGGQGQPREITDDRLSTPVPPLQWLRRSDRCKNWSL